MTFSHTSPGLALLRSRRAMPVAQPMSMLVVPHMSMPMPSPMLLMTGTAIVLPVAQSTPPATACGMNFTAYASTRPLASAARQPPTPGTQSAELCSAKSTSCSTLGLG